MYALGIDIGSSSIKVSLVDLDSSRSVGVIQEPDSEMPIDSPLTGWAEQNPEMWWTYTCKAILRLTNELDILPGQIGSIGIAYQMHGLVLLDENGEVLRPSIIWCDSRAVDIGKEAFETLGRDWCLSHCLNSPGNFTASKLRWVMDNEPDVYKRIHKVMLPGDYIAYRLTGEMNTTISGLSEGVMWDFSAHMPAIKVFSHLGVRKSFIPEVHESIGLHGRVSARAAEETGLSEGTPLTYRGGDQPNNAMSLGVLNPGQIAATGGTSGVIYAVTDEAVYDRQSRVNGFAHINHTSSAPRIGILLCINGAGILYAWMRMHVTSGLDYDEMEKMANAVAPGSDGLSIIPFGNGAERILQNRDSGVHIGNLQLNRHTRAHLLRAALEGIAFSFVYGFEIMKQMGVKPDVIRVGNDNLFRSEVFSCTVANLLQYPVEVVNTTGATGAARASAVGIGAYRTLEEAVARVQTLRTITPGDRVTATPADYRNWEAYLKVILG